MSRDCRRKFDPPTSCVYISKIEGVARGCGAVGVVRSVLSRLLAFSDPGCVGLLYSESVGGLWSKPSSQAESPAAPNAKCCCKQ
jgi:hypothetical protein